MDFVASPNFSRGRSAQVRLVVIHTMESGESGSTAEGCASFFSNRASGVSAHYCVDNDSAVQCVREEDTAWTCGNGNSVSINLEHAGTARQNPDEWHDEYSISMLRDVSAPLVASICNRWGIPIRYVGPEQILAGEGGITGHVDINHSLDSGDHWDPGPSFPWDEYIGWVAAAAGRAPDLGGGTPNAPAPPSNLPSVRDQQLFLAKIGIDPGPIDGVAGPRTAAAVAEWQRRLGVTADGSWGPVTQAAHERFFAWLASQQPAAPAPAPGPDLAGVAAGIAAARTQVLRRGSKGDAVFWLQACLNNNGASLVTDSDFGPMTERAVKAFQRDRGLVVDGIVGPQTWGALLG